MADDEFDPQHAFACYRNYDPLLPNGIDYEPSWFERYPKLLYGRRRVATIVRHMFDIHHADASERAHNTEEFCNSYNQMYPGDSGENDAATRTHFNNVLNYFIHPDIEALHELGAVAVIPGRRMPYWAEVRKAVGKKLYYCETDRTAFSRPVLNGQDFAPTGDPNIDRTLLATGVDLQKIADKISPKLFHRLQTARNKQVLMSHQVRHEVTERKGAVAMADDFRTRLAEAQAANRRITGG